MIGRAVRKRRTAAYIPCAVIALVAGVSCTSIPRSVQRVNLPPAISPPYAPTQPATRPAPYASVKHPSSLDHGAGPFGAGVVSLVLDSLLNRSSLSKRTRKPGPRQRQTWMPPAGSMTCGESEHSNHFTSATLDTLHVRERATVHPADVESNGCIALDRHCRTPMAPSKESILVLAAWAAERNRDAQL